MNSTTNLDQNNLQQTSHRKRLMSRRQVANLLGVHPETIKRYQQRGLLPAIVINSRLVRYEPEDVEKLLHNGRVG